MITARRLLIRGGRVILPSGTQELDLLIESGRIRALLESSESDALFAREKLDAFDAGGLLVFPGVIDTHVHFKTGSSHCDTLIDAACAAALGGTTTLIGHVSSDLDLLGEIHRQRQMVQECPIDAAFHAIIGPQQDPSLIVPELAKLGVQSFKFFMAYQDRGLGMNDAQLLKAFRAVAAAGGIALVHAEEDAVISTLTQQMIERGATSFTDYPDSRPSETEVEAIRRAIALARDSRVRLYIVHVSTPDGLALIRQSSKTAAPSDPSIYAETCPKYLLLNRNDYSRLGGKAVVAPPLRSAGEQNELLQAFYRGEFDALGSDHSPHGLASKSGSSFPEVRPGAPGAQTFFPVMLDAVLAQGNTNSESQRKLASLQHCTSIGPAQIFNLFPKKGHIGVGADADLVFVDPNSEWHVQVSDLRSNVGYSLYEGNRLRHQPLHSMVRGEWVLRDRSLVRSKGGAYIGRDTS